MRHRDPTDSTDTADPQERRQVTRQASGLGRFGRALARGIADALYPTRCPVCGRGAIPDGLGLCAACDSALTEGFSAPRCPRCASRRSPLLTSGRCQSCRPLPLAFDGALAAADWDGPMSALVTGLKFQRRQHLAPTISRYMIAAVVRSTLRIDAVVPVPLHWRARLNRRFDQAALLAARVASELALPLTRGLRRRRHTRSQRHFSRTERFKNIHGAFESTRAAECLRGRSVLLVDDVMTTGATSAECARTLKRAGVKRVIALVAARAPLRAGRVAWPTDGGGRPA